ncbi:MAG: 30S ribosomal protein S12 methylthiotransferase accessory factor YcaO [Methylophilaceae bacterium]
MTTTESFIPGKDASLEFSIQSMQAKLTGLGFHIEERSWLNEIEGIWSVHIRDRDCPIMFSNGKGGSELASRASALGEYFERLSTNYFWTHFYLGEEIASRDYVHYPQEQWFQPNADGSWPAHLLTPELHAFYNPESSINSNTLIDLNSGNAERGICAIPYVRQRDNATVLFPVNVIGNLYVSNGMSAGNTQTEARTQALSEIFERDVKARIIAEGICLPDVPEEVIARYPRIAAGIKGLREAGFGILVKDASLGGQYPVMNVTLLNPKDQGCFASFGAHPRFEVALERSLTELLQGRALESLGGFPEPGFDLEEIASSTNIEIHFVDSSGVISWNFLNDKPDFEFVDWDFGGTSAEECQWCVDKIHAEKRDIYIADFSHLNVYACRILVPSMSEIYPIDDLEWENNSVGNLLRPAILRLHELNAEECSQLLDIFNELGLDDHKPIVTIIGLTPDADSVWKDLRVGELKTLLALAIGDKDAIQEGCDWLKHYNQLSEPRLRVYRCIETMLNLEGGAASYLGSLQHLYGADVVKKAMALLNPAGNMAERFFGLTTLGKNFEGSKMHQQLLIAYDKLHASKLKVA